MQRDKSYWLQAQSNPPPGCHWQHWQCASTLTQQFRLDRNGFCWCLMGFFSRSVCRFISCSCFCHLIIVIDQNHSFNIKWSLFECFAGYSIDYIGIIVYPFVSCIMEVSIILESMFTPLWVVLWTTKAVNRSVWAQISARCWFPNIQDQTLWMPYWPPISKWGNEDIVQWFGLNGCHYNVHALLLQWYT